MGKEITIAPPVILAEGTYQHDDLHQLKQHPIWRTIDLLESQLGDLFEIMHPDLLGDPHFIVHQREYLADRIGAHLELAGDWAYLPWSGHLLHTATRAEQFVLRTNRNRSLITPTEQGEMAAARVAIAGLSVGGGVATDLAYAGIDSLNLADFDRLATPNLNRVQATLADVGRPKAQITAERIWSLNPYAGLQLFTQGLSRDNLADFLGGTRPVSLAFDEIDDFAMKVRLRHQAKRHHIPVVMLTSLGDSLLVDMERYDTDPTLTPFNGLIGDLEPQLLEDNPTEEAKKRFAAQIISIDNVPTRAIQSLSEIGVNLVGRPQLGSTVTAASGVAVFVARQIILGAPLKSGRYRIDLNAVLGLPLETAPSHEREVATQQLFGK